MSSVSSVPEQRVVLGNVSWATYLTLVEDDGLNPRGRMAYDQGVLEIMSPSGTHETAKGLIGRMVETFTFERSIEIRSMGSTTFKRSDLAKGIEGDECYYIQNVEAVRGAEEIDLTMHPAPDLAIEVDISRSSTIKLGIYAALEVTEVWRYDGETIHILVLRQGEYTDVDQSTVLPKFPIKHAISLLQQRTSMGETELVRQFLSGVRQHAH